MVDFNLIPILPELFLAMVAMGLLIVGVARPDNQTFVISGACMGAMVLAILILFKPDWGQGTDILNNMFRFDYFAGLIKFFILIGGIFSLALSSDYLKREGLSRFEYPILVTIAVIGMMLMVSANNLISLYVSLELQSLSLYVLAAFRKNSVSSSEAGVKYFSLGALSSGMLLFGSSLIYGFTGSLDFEVISQSVQDPQVGAVIGLVMILAGLAFKISAVPFHMWMPDVYQGAPTSVTAFFAIVPKVAAMALLTRLLFGAFGALEDQWMQIIYALSIGSMLVGAFGALTQSNFKRLMAYSSIGHMGYALIGLICGVSGVAALSVYLFIYMLMSAGVFAVVLSLRKQERAFEKIKDLKGLSKSHKGLAIILAILMFSMSGIPPMAGFFGKLVIFQAAVDAEFYVLATLGVLFSVVAAFYYLRIIKLMFFDACEEPLDRDAVPFMLRFVMLTSAFFVVFFAVYPSLLLRVAETAAFSLF